MAGYHTTSVSGVRAFIQNKTTGLYLNNRGYWQEKKIKVSFPNKEAAKLQAIRCNATCELTIREFRNK